MTVVYLSFGSNIDDKEGAITHALCLLSEKCEVKKKSHLYLTEPVSKIQQDWFLNCAIEGETSLDPIDLLTFIQSIERTLGRVRTGKNGPRIIDIDILFYGNEIVQTKNLVIPHPLLQDRLFVLQPMMDLSPVLIHPILKKSIQVMYKEVPKDKKVLLYK